MDFARPWLLGLLLFVPLAGVLHGLLLHRLRQLQASIGMGQDRLLPRFLPGRARLRHGLLYGALTLLLLALAGPRWGEQLDRRGSRGADLLVLFDCSRSMLADDVHPDRLAVARRKLLDLVRDHPEHRVALIPFAGIATLRSPLTGDHQAFATMLEECHPDLFPAERGLQGTAIGRAVQRALGLRRDPERGQAIVIVSDGADPEAETIEDAATAAAEARIPIYGLFIGDPERTVAVTIDGREEIMDADRSTLDLLARRSDGLSVTATITNEDIELIARHLREHVLQAAWEEERLVVASERYLWFLVPAILLAGGGLLLPTARRNSGEGRA